MIDRGEVRVHVALTESETEQVMRGLVDLSHTVLTALNCVEEALEVMKVDRVDPE